MLGGSVSTRRGDGPHEHGLVSPALLCRCLEHTLRQVERLRHTAGVDPTVVTHTRTRAHTRGAAGGGLGQAVAAWTRLTHRLTPANPTLTSLWLLRAERL